MTRFVSTLAFAALTLGLAAPVAAQDIPPGQSCGGLFCDMGLFGHKVPVGPDGTPPTPAQMAAAEAADPHRLPCNDFVCRAFGGNREAEAAPAPAPAPVPVEPVKAETPMKKKHHTKVAARTAAPKADAPKADAVKPDPTAH